MGKLGAGRDGKKRNLIGGDGKRWAVMEETSYGGHFGIR